MPHNSAVTSPQQTTTPTSISDYDSPATSPEMPKRPGGLSDGPNARSKTITVADSEDTFGVLNRHPAVTEKQSSPEKTNNQLPGKVTFRVGVSEDKNKRCRRTMEDAHSFVYDFAGVKGQGYFAVFDGHAGKHAAEWCGQNFHEYLLDAILTHPDQPIPDLMNKTFHVVDSRLSHLAQAGKTSSGCTAVTAFLRLERGDGSDKRGYINKGLQARGLMEGKGEDELEAQTAMQPGSRRSSMGGGTSGQMGGAGAPFARTSSSGSMARKMSSRRIKDFVKSLTGTGSSNNKDDDNALAEDDDDVIKADDGTKVEAIDPNDPTLKRVLYTANVGDARAVICRGGKAVRLTYDHKGSDAQEAKRITDAGGFVMNNRVNGVLAVTRSLGDSSMKEFVVGSPYTTETALDDQDEFLIVACDGLWDVCEDQEAVDLIRTITDPQDASKYLLDHAMSNYSTDNLSVMVIRFTHA
uniref:Protein phosphatase n=1 Tax=Kwoniella bestiolae CBS 10118 TaxID=1296100 RepID=A0A1B9G7Y8_9TREE|nr:protein phosphatase [Kwoniella bestiolae CBS 10118]OCF27139.1 protein phosphatase [Kwoniella bestiolae CBS 10118]